MVGPAAAPKDLDAIWNASANDHLASGHIIFGISQSITFVLFKQSENKNGRVLVKCRHKVADNRFDSIHPNYFRE